MHRLSLVSSNESFSIRDAPRGRTYGKHRGGSQRTAQMQQGRQPGSCISASRGSAE